MSPVHTWLEEMRNIWLEKRPDDIAGLLSLDGFAYYENPFYAPMTTSQEVVDAWQEIRNQDIDYINIKILYETNVTGVAEWHFKMHDHPLHVGGYFLRLDDVGKCLEFRQWWTLEQ